MSTLTKNYSFVKPAQTETYDVDVFNSNVDAIDAALKAMETKFFPPVGRVIVTTDGTNPSSQYSGTAWSLLDSGLYIKTAGGTIAAKSVSGSNEVTLANKNIPPHIHTATVSSAGDHSHSGNTDAADLSGNIRVRANEPNYKSSNEPDFLANGRFSVQQDGLRSEGNADNNKRDRIIHFNGNHLHSYTTNTTGKHTHTVTIGETGGGESFTIQPKSIALYFWVRTE